MEMERTEPPVILVKTWVGLITSNECQEVKDRSKKMLIEAFGDIKTAAEYCAKNNIAI